MKTSHMIGAALLAAGVFVGSGQLATAVESTSVADVHAVTDAHEMTTDSTAADEKTAPRRYGKGPTQGGGRGRRGCGCG